MKDWDPERAEPTIVLAAAEVGLLNLRLRRGTLVAMS